MAYTGWELTAGSRDHLLALYPPVYPDVVAHHVTLNPGVPSGSEPPPAAEVVVVGHVDDGAGVQVLVVTVNGELRRPDGRLFHVTWSLDRAGGRKPVDSNDVLAGHPFEPQYGVPVYTRPFVSA